MNYHALFGKIKTHCNNSTSGDIDIVMGLLVVADLPTTRSIDFYLGTVTTKKNSLAHRIFPVRWEPDSAELLYTFFARRNEWELINRAFSAGLIDYIQEYSRKGGGLQASLYINRQIFCWVVRNSISRDSDYSLKKSLI